MKGKSGKFAAALLALALSMCSVPLMGASAAPPPSTEPRIYIELTKDDKGIRADVIMENVPDFRNAVIGFSLNKSWKCTDVITGSEFDVDGDQIVDIQSHAGNIINQYYKYDTKKRYVLLRVANNFSEESNHNGIVDSFYVEKTEWFDLSDSGLNLHHETLANVMAIFKADGTNIFEDVYFGSPRMLEANEFMYGDVTGDGYISGSDATWALSVCGSNGERVKVTDFYNNYTDIIKNMKAAYAADVNKDGYIDETDANIILYTYTQLLSDKGFDEIDGIVGDIDVYEVY